MWCSSMNDGLVLPSNPSLEIVAGGISSSKEDLVWLLSAALPILDKDSCVLGLFTIIAGFVSFWPVNQLFIRFNIFSPTEYF